MSAATFDRRQVVPAGEGRAVRIEEGMPFAVVDLYGGQVGDLFILADDGSGEAVSPGHTRVAAGRMFPGPGQAFVSERRRPLATVIEDDRDGDHDMLCAACDRARYLGLGVTAAHANCADNFASAASGMGIAVQFIPQPVNVFMSVRVASGALEYLPASSQPEDRLVLRAETPLAVVLSSCPQDLSPINHGVITDLAIDY